MRAIQQLPQCSVQREQASIEYLLTTVCMSLEKKLLIVNCSIA